MSKCLVLFVEGDTEVEFYKQVIANARRLRPNGMFDTSIECKSINGVGGFKNIVLRKFVKEIKTKYDEYYVQINHEMTKNHYISFVAALSSDGMQIVKLYPEGKADCRFKIRGVKRIYCFCNRDGLFYIDVNKYIDGKDKQYDDTQERMEPEKIADKLFG